MLETINSNKFQYTKLSPEEQKSRGILGTLYGPIADTKEPTRNGRLYPRDAWEQAINDPLFQEGLRNKTILCELEHPADREDTDPREACACLASAPKIGDDGMLYGEFHILDLPNGRILKTLCDYGTVVGISSRGTGDLVEDFDGNSSVDPDSFDLRAFDVVLTPAVEKARMNFVKESLGSKSLRESLNQLVNNSDDADKKIMESTIKFVEQKLNEDNNTQKSDNIDNSTPKKSMKSDELGVDNVKPNIVVKRLQEALKSKAELESRIQELQEQLAVSDTKVKGLEEELSRYKQSTIRLSKKASTMNDLNKENGSLKEEVERKSKIIKSLTGKISSLQEQLNNTKNSSTQLTESMSNQDKKIKLISEKLKKEKENNAKQVDALNEQIKEIKGDFSLKESDLNKQLEKSTKLVEKYKSQVLTLAERYISSKAKTLGVSSNEIKNRLGEKYNLDDVDNVCEELQQFTLRMSGLPFKVTKGSKVSIKENYPTPSLDGGYLDDTSNLRDIVESD